MTLLFIKCIFFYHMFFSWLLCASSLKETVASFLCAFEEIHRLCSQKLSLKERATSPLKGALGRAASGSTCRGGGGDHVRAREFGCLVITSLVTVERGEKRQKKDRKEEWKIRCMSRTDLFWYILFIGSFDWWKGDWRKERVDGPLSSLRVIMFSSVADLMPFFFNDLQNLHWLWVCHLVTQSLVCGGGSLFYLLHLTPFYRTLFLVDRSITFLFIFSAKRGFMMRERKTGKSIEALSLMS